MMWLTKRTPTVLLCRVFSFVEWGSWVGFLGKKIGAGGIFFLCYLFLSHFSVAPRFSVSRKNKTKKQNEKTKQKLSLLINLIYLFENLSMILFLFLFFFFYCSTKGDTSKDPTSRALSPQYSSSLKKLNPTHKTQLPLVV